MYLQGGLQAAGEGNHAAAGARAACSGDGRYQRHLDLTSPPDSNVLTLCPCQSFRLILDLLFLIIYSVTLGGIYQTKAMHGMLVDSR